MSEKRKVFVIGGGIAGMTAAVAAKEAGAEVVVVEHQEDVLKKLLLTGNGRCNFSNSEISRDHYHGSEKLIERIVTGFSCDDILDFMVDELSVEALEVFYRFGKNGYFYPSTNQAKTVRDAYLKKCRDLGIEICCLFQTESVQPLGEGGYVVTGITSGKRIRYQCEKVIFACGSNACPETGSDSSIYPVLKALEVPFLTYLPALCAIKSDSSLLGVYKGLRCDAKVMLQDLTEGIIWESPEGEVQFNEHSLSGIPCMQLSRYAAIGRSKGNELLLSLKITSVNNKKGQKVPENFEFRVTGTDGFKKCQCCSGGVDANCMDPENFEYRKYPGIYFAGEMTDVDGDCGGYNIHYAIASGLLCGRDAAR